MEGISQPHVLPEKADFLLGLSAGSTGRLDFDIVCVLWNKMFDFPRFQRAIRRARADKQLVRHAVTYKLGLEGFEQKAVLSAYFITCENHYTMDLIA